MVVLMRGFLVGAALLVLGGCASVRPYRIEVVQGNVLTQEQIALVQPGMDKAQVREALGSPLLADIFHANRWDYVFTIDRQGAPAQQRRVVAWFEGEQLKQLEGASDLPSERDFVGSIDTFKLPRTTLPLTLTDAQRSALPANAASAPQAPVPPAAAPRSYPPLER
jgi:outer membrane protein assembly factor BamE